MPSAVIEIVIILLLLLANGFFAMSEIAVVSARRARLQQRLAEGDARAADALALAEHPDDFLSTVQVGITLIGILAGAFGGATVARYLAAMLATIPALAPYSSALGLAFVVALITYFSLVIGELAPKRLALNAPEQIAMSVARPMRGLARFVAPLVWLLSTSTDLLMRLFGFRPSGEPSVTEEEIKVMIAQGAQAGVFSAAESEVVQNVFRLADRTVSSVMTPRLDIVWLDLDDDPDQIRCKVTESGFSRFPVCQGGLENVVGIVEAKALLVCQWEGQALDLSAVMRPPQFVPETSSAVSLLSLFQESGLHCALAVDEYGGVQGLVTLHDVLHAALGDVTEAVPGEEPLAVQREDGSWLLDGRLAADDFRALLGLRSDLPGEEEGAYETLGGFVMMRLGRIPQVADHFEWAGLRFEVVDMDGRRVDKVLVMPVVSATGQGE
ncbi:MAG: hemolysin family protein [Anaerolineae bacterium]